MNRNHPASSPCQAPAGYWDPEDAPMNRPAGRTVLFLGAGDDPARAATQFNAVAGRLGLGWSASARAVGDVSAADLAAARVIGLGAAEVEPAARQRFPDRAVEFWPAAGDVETAVLGLVARLLGGRADAPEPEPAFPPAPPKKVLTAKVGRETAGRRGKGVTTVFGLSLSAAELEELAGKLKHRLGTGGTVKDGRIEIQGDNRDRVMAELEKLGFRVKRAGG
jgi:translation initiation factor 1